MIDTLYGDSECTNPIAMALIAIIVAALMFGGCTSGGCGDCCIDRTAAETAK